MRKQWKMWRKWMWAVLAMVLIQPQMILAEEPVCVEVTEESAKQTTPDTMEELSQAEIVEEPVVGEAELSCGEEGSAPLISIETVETDASESGRSMAGQETLEIQISSEEINEPETGAGEAETEETAEIQIYVENLDCPETEIPTGDPIMTEITDDVWLQAEEVSEEEQDPGEILAGDH